MENKETPQQKHIVVVPSPGMGHLIPLAEFAKHLHSKHHYFSISIILPSSTSPTPAQTSYLSTLPSNVSHTFLPPVDPSLLPDGVAHEVTISHVHEHSLQHVRESLMELTRRTHVVSLITDLFGTIYFDVGREYGVLPYMYFTSTAMCLSLFLSLPRLDETVSCEYRDMKKPVTLPGCVPLHGKDFVDPIQDRKDVAYRVMLDYIKKYTSAEGIFINTFFDLEPGALHAFKNEYPNLPPVYPVGATIQSGLGGGSNSSNQCLDWLDQQPPGSVLFVSFGSGGSLPIEQLHELAIGLEKSGQRFLWVVRSPGITSDTYIFTGLSKDDPLGFLPEGYVDRVKGRGLLVPSWAPQIEILAHKSTGGFLSHCGWNSTLESLVNGVPLIAWPLYAEQKMNAVMLNEGLKIALRPQASENGLVEADEIAKVVKELMEGEEGGKVRARMGHLCEAAKRTRAEDGESTKVLNQVTLEWSRK